VSLRGQPPTRSDDERHLMMLHLRDMEGMSASRIAERMGTTKSAVLGVLQRQQRGDPWHAKTTAGDGTMKPLWWRK
jgi:hypothetical protein